MTYKEAFVATSTDVSTYVIGLVVGVVVTCVSRAFGCETDFAFISLYALIGSVIGGIFGRKSNR